MRHIHLYVASVLVCTGITLAQVVQPGTIPMTPMVTSGLVRTKIIVPDAFKTAQGLQIDRFVNVPEGWTARVFYAGNALSKPRFMAWGPDSVLYVANMNGQNVLALPDADGNGVAESPIVAASGFSTGHDVRFWRDTMYVCQQAGVVAFQDQNKDRRWENRRVVVDRTTIPNWSGGRHGTRTLVVDSVHNALFVSVGSNGNADREAESGKFQRAMIERFDLSGKNRRVYATGIRNAVGMTLHPRTGTLWANNNGSDLQGDNVPPEWIDIIRDNGFYGYPFAYHHQNWFDLSNADYKDILPLTKADTSLFESMVPPAALVTAHMAPMAMEFSPLSFASPFTNGCFVVMRGSWNRTPASGYKVVFLAFDNDADTIANFAIDFCTGFMTDSVAKQAWARPVGIALHHDGSVYLSSDDLTPMILKLTPPTLVGVRDTDVRSSSLRVEPNPAAQEVRIRWDTESASQCLVELIDLSGTVLITATAPLGIISTTGLTLPVGGIEQGAYIVRCTSNNRIITSNITIVR